jgi:hypothetical protein
MAITISGSGITSANIADGTIVNADINSSAAIAGSKLTGTGKVLQVVQGSTTTTVNSSTSTLADTTLTATITPTATTSKILCLVEQHGCNVANDTGITLKLFRGASSIHQMSIYQGYTASASDIRGGISGSYLDSPATTSATTYKTQFNSKLGISGTAVQVGGETSTIVLMEIGV